MISRIVLILLLIFTSFKAISQYDGKGENYSRYRPGMMWFFTGVRPASVEKPRKYDRLMVDLNFTNFISKGKWGFARLLSVGTNVHTMFDFPLVKDNWCSIGLGLTYSFQSIKHNQFLHKDSISDHTILEPFKNDSLFFANRFVQHSFSIPLELRFRGKSWRHLKVHLGTRIGINFATYQKDVTKDQGKRSVVRYNDLRDDNLYYVSSYIRFGLRNVSFYAQYQWTSTFTKKESFDMHPLQLGITLSLF